jgi:hypothetical protein
MTSYIAAPGCEDPQRLADGLAGAEFDSKAPGPVRDRVAQCQHQWLDTLERAARQAQDRQELRDNADPRQLGFELEAALLSANWYFRLFNDATYLDRARRAVRARLASEATPAGLHLVRHDPRIGSSPPP